MKILRKIIPAWLILLPSVALAQSSWFSRFYQPSFQTYRFGSSGGYGYGGGYGGGYGSGYGLWGIMYIVMSILSQVVVILISLAVVFFLYGVVKFILAGGETEKLKEAKNAMIYGIIGLFVMVSFWGMVNILRNTFELNDYYVPEVPYFYDYGGGYYGGGKYGSGTPGGGDSGTDTINTGD